MISSATVIRESTLHLAQKVLGLANCERNLESSKIDRIKQTPHTHLNALPPELLGIVFKFHNDGKGRCIHPLLLVCKYWYHTTVHNPDLWTLISIKVDRYQHFYTQVDNHIRQIQLCAQNSGDLSLDLDVEYDFDSPDANPVMIRDAMRRVFLELKGPESALTARWGSFHLVLPTINGNAVVGALDCGLVRWCTPRLTELSIEMLARPIEFDPRQSIPYFTNLSALRSLVVDHAYILDHIRVILERLDILDIRLGQQQFNVEELIRLPRLNTLILRYEEKKSSDRAAFSSSTLELLKQPNTIIARDDRSIGARQLGIRAPRVPTLCIQSAWLMKEDLPNLSPVTLAWDPLDPSPLKQFRFTGLAKASIRTLLSQYSSSEHLVLPEALSRSFFILVHQEPALLSSLPTVKFDQGMRRPRIYNMINGKLRRLR